MRVSVVPFSPGADAGPGICACCGLEVSRRIFVKHAEPESPDELECVCGDCCPGGPDQRGESVHYGRAYWELEPCNVRPGHVQRRA